MARRLRDLEKAKLQDQNVTLSQQAHRLGSTLDAHLRFSQRANSARAQVTGRLASTEEELRAAVAERREAEQARDSAEQALESVRAQLAAAESVHGNEVARLSGKWDIERDRLIECIASSQAEAAAAKMSAAEATAAAAEAEAAAVESSDHVLEVTRRTAQTFQEQAVKDQREARAEIDHLTATVGNLQREIAIKDKQLGHLRSQLRDATSHGGATSFLGMAVAAGTVRSRGGQRGGVNASTSANDELIEILEEEKREMREAFEQKIQDLKLELEQANSRRLKEARE